MVNEEEREGSTFFIHIFLEEHFLCFQLTFSRAVRAFAAACYFSDVINVNVRLISRLPRTSFRRKEAERSDIDWVRFRTVILDALDAFPGAREAVVHALLAHCGDEG
jgi:hypothetical protein